MLRMHKYFYFTFLPQHLQLCPDSFTHSFTLQYTDGEQHRAELVVGSEEVSFFSDIATFYPATNVLFWLTAVSVINHTCWTSFCSATLAFINMFATVCDTIHKGTVHTQTASHGRVS